MRKAGRIQPLPEAVAALVQGWKLRLPGGLHAPHPVRRRPRAAAPGPYRPHRRPAHAGHPLRPDDRPRPRRADDLLLRRQPGRRVAAPHARRRRARLAAADRARRALPCRPGQRLRGRRLEPALRHAARLRRHRPARAQRGRRLHRLPVHRGEAHRGAGHQPRRGDHPRPAGRQAGQRPALGARRASRRRRCSPPSTRSSPSRRSSTS